MADDPPGVPSPRAEPERLRLVELANAYLDAVPRGGADALPVGPFTLFRSLGAWSYYARPALEGRQPVTAQDLADLHAACREQSLPLALEWLHDCCPSLEAAARAHGLVVHEYVLMALVQPPFVPAPAGGTRVRLIDPDDPEDPAVPVGRAVADLAFGEGGTAVGAAGVAERNEALRRLDPAVVDQVRNRVASGQMVLAVAERDPDGVVASGAYQPVGEVAEIVGVATLPAARRQGAATALSALLAATAFERGIALVILSADNEDVARVYAKVGFERLGRSMAAEPPE